MQPNMPNPYGKVWSLAWPMMISNMSVPLLGLVDAALLGHLEAATFLGAVALGAVFINLVYWSFGFLRMGTTSLIARNSGSASVDDGSDDESGIMARSLLLALVFGIGVMVVVPPLIPLIVSILNASSEVAPLCAEYINIRIYSAPAVLLAYTISGWLIGHQQVKLALTLVLTINVTNIILDVVFIVGFGWQSAGAAWATLIAEYLGLLVGLAMLAPYIRKQRHRVSGADFSLAALRELVGINGHLMLRTLLLLFAMNFFTAQGARLGDDLLATNAILFQLAMFAAYVMDGFSHAAEALCGRAVGAGQRKLFDHITSVCRHMMGATAILFAIAFTAGGIPLVGVFSDLEAVRAAGITYLPWLVTMPIVSYTAYLYDGVFIGAGATREMFYTMLVATVGIYLPAWWLTLNWHNHGLWLAFILFNLARSVGMSQVYHRRLKLQPAVAH